MCFLLASVAAVLRGNAAGAEPIDFIRDVQPILRERCYSCHGETKQKSGLRLDVKAAALKGGELYGTAIVGHDAKSSPLVDFVANPDADLVMPPDGPPLSASQIAVLSRWVEEGAVWPDGIDTAIVEDRLDHWSFQSLREVQPPDEEMYWSRNEIDQFVATRLAAKELRPSKPAARRSWLRRVTLDLTGLPPTPDELRNFLADETEMAFETVVDRLLASSRYGERFAQHWLDVVRYADTHGFEVNTERPNAWPYRDYVIQAFNNDLPYDQFVREQIVGDAPGNEASTGFLITASVLLPGQIGKDEASKRLARQDSLDEIVVNVSQTFLGLSVGCARCHDHKFDPISQHDYYAMQALVAGVEYKDREILTPKDIALRKRLPELAERQAEIESELTRFVPLANSNVERPMINSRRNVDRFEPIETRAVRLTVLATNKYEPCIDEFEVFTPEGVNVALTSNDGSPSASGTKTSPNRHELRFANDGKYGNSRSWMSDETEGGWLQIDFAKPQTIDRVVWGRDRQGKFSDRTPTNYRVSVAVEDQWLDVASADDRKPFKDGSAEAKSERRVIVSTTLSPDEKKVVLGLKEKRKTIAAEIRKANNPRKVFAGQFRTPDKIQLLTRGDPEQPKAAVQPAVLSSLGDVELPLDAGDVERRRALADWIVNPDNPMTARVMVNRIWQSHFGMGIVASSSDFGRLGTNPSHPDLLDWLAVEFIDSGWSIKHVHRLIALSSTYRQSSIATPKQTQAGRNVDAGNRLLWRFPSRRLEAETIRDSMLAVSGRLNWKMYGRGYNLFDKRGGLTGFEPIQSFDENGRRRMIYAHKVRRERDGVFGAFDCPDNGQATPRRRHSTTPIQALNLFNSQFTIDESAVFESRVINEVGSDLLAQIRHAYELALGREPSTDEVAEAMPVVEAHGLSTLCRVLFNSNEFLFLP